MDIDRWQYQRRRALERDEYECQFCGMDSEEHHEEYGMELSVHHIIPQDAGGDHALPNLITVCRGCHGVVETLTMRRLADYYQLDSGDLDELQSLHTRLEDLADTDRDTVEDFVPFEGDAPAEDFLWELTARERAIYLTGKVRGYQAAADLLDDVLESIANGGLPDWTNHNK